MTSTQPKPVDAAADTTEAGNSRFESLKLTAVTAHPNNVRKSLTDIAGLADSIRAQGVLQPIVVAPAKAKNKYVIITGHRRHAAAKAAGVKEIPAVIREDLVDVGDQIEAMLTENLQRSDLNAIEEGDGYQELIDLGITIKDMSTRVGTPQKRIRERVKLSASPADLRDRVANHQVTIEEALTLQSFADDEKIYADLQKALGTHNWDWSVRRAKEQRTRDAARAKIAKELLAEKAPLIAWADLTEARSTLSKKAGQTLVWDKLPGRPDDALTNPLVVVTLREGMLGPVEHDVMWYRAIPQTDAPQPNPVGNTAVTPGKSIEPVDTEPEDPAVAEKLAAEIAQREADKAAAEKLNADLATAAEVRRSHLRNVIGTYSVEQLRDMAASSARRTFLELRDNGEIDWSAVNELIGLDGYDPDKTGYAQNNELLTDEITVWLASQPVEVVATATRLCVQLYIDDRMSTAQEWINNGGGYISDWADEVRQVFGYEFSDVENSMAERITPATD